MSGVKGKRISPVAPTRGKEGVDRFVNHGFGNAA